MGARTGTAGTEQSLSKDHDFDSWLLAQAHALRTRRHAIDREGIAEELEYLARKDRIAVRSHLQNLLCHLLKWAYQANNRSKSWRASINESRDRIEDLLEESPSLKNQLVAAFADPKVYRRAVRDAELDTEGKVRFPAHCPWSLETVLAPDFLPEQPD
jgi:hypothetical protein